MNVFNARYKIHDKMIIAQDNNNNVGHVIIHAIVN